MGRPLTPLPLRVSVKALCAFAAKSGDLDLRFVPAPSAAEGQAGHRLVQMRRGPAYESEVALSTCFGSLEVRGRADGWDPQRGRVEEIKTFRGDFEQLKANHRALHWAQARCYAWMLCERDALPAIEVALVYLDLADEHEVLLEERWTAEDLRLHFERLCACYLLWAEAEARHREQLDVALASLRFPHADFRAGQRELAESVYRAAGAGRHLLAEAPTGIGKTAATLFPLLRARPAHRIDKIFFLTAKTSGRAVALASLRAMDVSGADGAALRVLELAAREKVCVYPGRACHGEACPLARGFYDRLPAARAQAVRAAPAGPLDLATLRAIAAEHELCPYFLAQELVRWCEVVIGDYNYFFDGSAFLHALTREEEWRVALLVDESHNLLERARGMYSARFPDLQAFIAASGQGRPPASIRRALAALEGERALLQRDQEALYEAHDRIPEAFERALQQAVHLLAEHFGARPAEAHGPLQQCFFDLLAFARLAESFGRHSVLESMLAGADAGSEGPALAIRNLVPAPFLKARFEACLSAVCFSGTLSPFDFYRDLLGLPENTATLAVASPFRSEQLGVHVALDLSTRWRDRGRSLAALTDLIAAQFATRPGNYLAFFGSFDYLAQAAAAFAERHPGLPAWSQQRGMGEQQRDAFLARFVAGGRGIGFAVLGGAFGEGIDLPGERLIGAFVAGLGLPTPSSANELMRERIEALFGQGFEYTYLYPGLQKVVQAAGRVIRSESDEGVLYLLDDRFARPEIRALLPPWWELRPIRLKRSRAPPDVLALT